MLILSQDGEAVVNVNNLQAITIYQINEKIAGKDMEKKFRILALNGTTDDECLGIGDYVSVDRAKEVLQEIWQEYGAYLHRHGGPAILKGSVDVPEAFWVLPKTYKMPEV